LIVVCFQFLPNVEPTKSAGLNDPAQIIQKIISDAADYTNTHPEYGFLGDPLHPVPDKYYGYLIQAGVY
jgi:subtilisin